MNRALLGKAFLDGRWMLLGCALLMFAFHWLFVWITKLIPMDTLMSMFADLPPWIQSLPGIELKELFTYEGRIAMAYLEPVTLLASAAWGVSRGSDAVSGEIGRGTMELVLAQPVRRIAVLGAQMTVMTLGAAVIALAAWLGTAIGLATVDLGVIVPVSTYIPSAINLFALTFFVAAASTLASSFDRYRSRTIGLVVSIYIVQYVIKLMARMVDEWNWMMYVTFHGAYQPQVMAVGPERAWELSLRFDGLLILLGVVSFAIAAAIFCRRDLPAPL